MPGYNSSSSETTSVTVDADGRLIVTGRLCFSYSADGTTSAERAGYLATMAKRGWKIGLQLRPGQDVARFSFAGTDGEIVLRPNRGITEELGAAFPCPGGGMRWVGLVPDPGERSYTWQAGELLTICYDFTLVITNGRCLPQGIVMALTYASGEAASFLEHYLLHVLLVADIPGVTSSASAIIDAKRRRVEHPAKPKSALKAARPSGATPSARRKPASHSRKARSRKGKKR
jgi:hypothetical protein